MNKDEIIIFSIIGFISCIALIIACIALNNTIQLQNKKYPYLGL